MNAELRLQHECWIWFHDNRQDLSGMFRRIKNEVDSHNGGKMAIMKQLNENKLTGIVPGTWDSFLLRNPMTWIEFKVGKNGLTHEQIEFMNIGEALGHEFYIVRTFQQFKNLINELYD